MQATQFHPNSDQKIPHYLKKINLVHIILLMVNTVVDAHKIVKIFPLLKMQKKLVMKISLAMVSHLVLLHKEEWIQQTQLVMDMDINSELLNLD